jgi:hypothetical protein
LANFADKGTSNFENEGSVMQKSKFTLRRSLPADMILVFIVLWSFACQKNNIHRTGLFSQWGQTQAKRQIASTNSSESFESFFDFKQVYIYCSINSVSPMESCYQKQVEIILNQYQTKYGNLSKEQLEEASKRFDLKIVEEQTLSVARDIVTKLESQISKLVEKRESFCKENSKFYRDRCLKQYIETDSLTVLNQFQNNYQNINGHEYLFLKNIIKDDFIAKLNGAKDRLESTEKKS